MALLKDKLNSTTSTDNIKPKPIKPPNAHLYEHELFIHPPPPPAPEASEKSHQIRGSALDIG
jgi:hypothetical protein